MLKRRGVLAVKKELFVCFFLYLGRRVSLCVLSYAFSRLCLNAGGMERTEQPWNSSYTYQVSKHSAEMLHNLNSQRKDGGRFCDVILRVGEESFPAHKAVLAACSEYFESVFSCPAEGDGEGKELEMHTISPKVFRDILDFAYTSRIVVRLECFPELMTAAKFLLMRSVIEICQEVIKQSNVQILVPPSRGGGGEHSFPRAAASDLSSPPHLDVANGAVFTDHGPPQCAVDRDGGGGGPAPTSDGSLASMPTNRLSPSHLTGNSVNGEGSPGSKRGRGRPKKEGAAGGAVVSSYNSSSQHGPANDSEGLLACAVCGKMFTDAAQLRSHEAEHGAFGGGRGRELIPADIAQAVVIPQVQGQAGPHENGLPPHSAADGHRKRERTRRHVGCELCGKVFRDVYHLNRHKLSHSGEKPYACPVCGLRFKRKDRMSYHVRSHDGSVGKPYVCQSCGKGFSRPDHLNGHIKQVHTTERPHKCQICNASFATRDRLRSHLACHEDKIPCQVCGKFLRAAYMTDHLKKHSEGPHNYCSICNKDLCTSRRLLVTFPETEGSFRGLSGPPVLPQPGPPALGLQPELLLGKPGTTPYFWECRSAGAPGFPLHGPLADGQENAGKCPHQDSDGSDTAFGDLSNGTELKPEHKAEGEELEVTSLVFNGEADGPAAVPCGSKQKPDPEKKFACGECGQTFRTKSYLNKHHQRVHKKHSGTGSSLGDLGSPFSPQQNMSLLESFGFQIVQSAFASSLVDSEVASSAMGLGDK
ncbi:POZ-, AT hook-, and zinc finger-containing protein 1 isoform X2 [Colossoma macropomum]|uniref:POZ-, AT hook-, and zinc finger-containing protein 1 isoform X2 n=1 Tax=Colossoma macropomum TaxID=42526 RepID=UPI001864585F|nr:POZ-, AT hook-, and zinc finger-containing protein 1 isoform X2 [Colossoma macropomum]